MTNTELTGSIKALLDEYKKAIDELISSIKPLNESQLSMLVIIIPKIQTVNQYKPF
ncbi:hypothetical protein [Flavobacterium psychrophilum]|uniref:MarR family transcriptional regulator n=1 Tax=Flavobacterium psychrophilum (strain ATCC 49511 / DSM 21280 / CIP 103535 / JIP02/86) TaxID=402612 RepID=A6GZX1_FLAPJ|nr:hypothetical protein [Flavobacterium psychrophilum]EKT3974903.1 hypothetical protein [Flavobacterium psychrophilum]EKT4525185.1 hypothetical protein [Flavobacterium psychrophilum]EKT4533090.1 hypothetical protein [Flavobacterium psychrophilum]EKT4537581.1 hypothetical protein [Flavobacterium psychrophilum]EKT4545529.1 hypothetical protein [Flavobacterium psychrophilum]